MNSVRQWQPSSGCDVLAMFVLVVGVSVVFNLVKIFMKFLVLTSAWAKATKLEECSTLSKQIGAILGKSDAFSVIS